MMKKTTIAAAICLMLATPELSRADIFINELLIEPSGDDFGQQFFELRGTPNQSLSNLSLVVLIGEEGGLGIVDQVFDLSSFSLGANGLFLWRDTPAVLSPAPHPQTNVGTTTLPLGPPAYFSNISQTFVLVSDFSANPLDDLDTNDDGTLDAMPWSGVIDAIGVRENDGTPANEFAFGAQLGFKDFPVTGFDPDAIFRDCDGTWYASDVTNNPGGPYQFENSEFVDISLNPHNSSEFTGNTLTPGSANVCLVPEPSAAMSLLLIGGVVAIRRRR